jgi:magnesium-transporting ATPase (P-type)
MDDNFSSIDKAILYGRTIFNSIRKFIIFQLTINVSAVLITFLSPLLGMENPLSIIQILWVNLVMDTLAALAFGGEPALRRYMMEKPKKRTESIISRYMWSEILTGSLWAFGLSFVFLLAPFVSSCFRSDQADKYLLTGFFAFYILLAVFNAFNARTEKMDLFDNIKKNHGFWQVLLLIVIVQVMMTYLGGDILHCYGLLWKEWLVVALMALTIIPVDLIRKAVTANRRQSE